MLIQTCGSLIPTQGTPSASDLSKPYNTCKALLWSHRQLRCDTRAVLLLRLTELERNLQLFGQYMNRNFTAVKPNLDHYPPSVPLGDVFEGFGERKGSDVSNHVTLLPELVYKTYPSEARNFLARKYTNVYWELCMWKKILEATQTSENP